MKRSLFLAPLATLAFVMACGVQAVHAESGSGGSATPVDAWVESVAGRFKQCDVAAGDFKQFPSQPPLPDPSEWTGRVDYTSQRGEDVFTHTVIIHGKGNVAYFITTGGTEGADVRGPIPLTYSCTTRKAKAAHQAAR